MDEPLGNIAFLARSSNRVRVLEALADGPRSRRDLGDLTDASRATLARVLAELEERRWIERSGDHVLATPLGRLVYEEFAPLVDAMRAADVLREVAHLVPDDAGLELGAFADATVERPNAGDPTAHMDRGFEHVEAAARFDILARTAIPRFAVEAARRLRREGFSFTATVPTAYVRGLAPDSTVLTAFRDIVDAGGAVDLVDGPIHHNVAVADDTVIVWLCDDAGTHQGLLFSEDRRVREWASTLIQRRREGATPLGEVTLRPETG